MRSDRVIYLLDVDLAVGVGLAQAAFGFLPYRFPSGSVADLRDVAGDSGVLQDEYRCRRRAAAKDDGVEQVDGYYVCPASVRETLQFRARPYAFGETGGPSGMRRSVDAFQQARLRQGTLRERLH
ncbi:hypothetical protein F1640_16395 [Novosphingobium sp. NBM11]|nr:hypothetical protein [Novosphingobium sp. NBM11]